MIGWVFFRANNLFDAVNYLKQMFGGFASNYTVVSFLSMKAVIAFVLGILFAGFLQRPLQATYEKNKYRTPVMICDLAIQLVTLVLCILLMVSGTYNPFIYFQF